MERRLAAVLVADVAGYSRLSEADEEGTRARFRTDLEQIAGPLVAAYRGRLVKTMGDGLLVEFASVVDAVRCAIEFQRRKTETNPSIAEKDRLVWRIGINLGDVIVEGDDIHGDGVNIAARIEALAEPGGIAMSAVACDQVRTKVAAPYEDIGEQRLKNIATPVRVYRLRVDGKRTPLRTRLRRYRRPALVAAAVSLAALVAVGVWQFRDGTSGLTGAPSIAVLPFDDLGADAATGRLASGITEDIITDLSRYRDFDVIARSSTKKYAGTEIDVRQIGQELNVRYVLEGSVQRQGDEVRVTAQLVSTDTGARVWSERWDRPAADIFAIQTEIAEHVANQLGGWGVVTTAERESARRERPGDLTAYETYLLALDGWEETEESTKETIRLLNEAVAKDPTLARAWESLSWAHGLLHRFDIDPQVELAASVDAAERAISLDPSDARAHAALGDALGWSGDFGRAAAEFEEALRLNPGSAEILTIYAGWSSSLGDPEGGAAAADRAIELNPDWPAGDGNFYRYAFFMAGRYEEALAIIDRQPQDTLTRTGLVIRAASYASLGRMDEAKEAVAQALAKHPDLTVESWISEPGFSEAEKRRFTEAMTKAGFPLCASEEALAEFNEPVRLQECLTP